MSASSVLTPGAQQRAVVVGAGPAGVTAALGLGLGYQTYIARYVC